MSSERTKPQPINCSEWTQAQKVKNKQELERDLSAESTKTKPECQVCFPVKSAFWKSWC